MANFGFTFDPMQVQIDIGFDQLVQIIKTLPVRQLNKLKVEIEQNTKITDANAGLEVLLLNGPVATQKQLDTIDANREAINQWRTK